MIKPGKEAMKTMICGDCGYMLDTTSIWNKKTVRRCNFGKKGHGYRVGLKSKCHLTPPRIYKRG